MKKKMMLIVFICLLFFCGCSSGKFTCSQCGEKVAQAYKDLAEAGAYICEDCAEEYYGIWQDDTDAAGKNEETATGATDVTQSVEEPTEAQEIKTEFTLNEILQGLQDGLFDGSVIAVKKGEVYYTEELLDREDFAIVCGGDAGNSFDDYIRMGEPELWTYPELSLSAGDQIVLFSTGGDLSGTIRTAKVREKVSYCVPLFFVYDDSQKGIRAYDAFSLDIVYSNKEYFTEVNGQELEASPLWNGRLLTGESGEVITLGKFEGTTFVEYTYTCDKIGYIMETYDKATGIIGQPTKPATVSYDLELAAAELTKDGYAVVMSDTVNPLEPGTYVINNCEIVITE